MKKNDDKTYCYKYSSNIDDLISKLSIGYKEIEIANPDDMLAYYSLDDINKYGVLGIKLKVM